MTGQRCEWCGGRGRVCDHPCLACQGTGSDGLAWVASVLGMPTTVLCDCEGKCTECACSGETPAAVVAGEEETP